MKTFPQCEHQAGEIMSDRLRDHELRSWMERVSAAYGIDHTVFMRRLQTIIAIGLFSSHHTAQATEEPTGLPSEPALTSLTALRETGPLGIVRGAPCGSRGSDRRDELAPLAGDGPDRTQRTPVGAADPIRTDPSRHLPCPPPAAPTGDNGPRAVPDHGHPEHSQARHHNVTPCPLAHPPARRIESEYSRSDTATQIRPPLQRERGSPRRSHRPTAFNFRILIQRRRGRSQKSTPSCPHL